MVMTMGALSGFVLGYLVGTRAGKASLRELTGAIQTIAASPEVRGLMMTAGALAGRALAAVTDDAPGGARPTPVRRAA